MAEEDVNLGQLRGLGDVEVGAAEGQDGWVVEDGLDIEEETEVALLDGLEGVEGVGVSLCGVVGAADAVVEDDHGAAARGGGAAGEGDGLEEVDGAVGADGRGGSHCAHHDDGLLALDGGVEEEGRLLHCVGTVGDDGALAVGVIESLLHEAGEIEEDAGGDAARVYVGDLHALDVGDIPQLWDGGDEDVDTEGTGLVACGLGV